MMTQALVVGAQGTGAQFKMVPREAGTPGVPPGSLVQLLKAQQQDTVGSHTVRAGNLLTSIKGAVKNNEF